jgi:hypothetical protein
MYSVTSSQYESEQGDVLSHLDAGIQLCLQQILCDDMLSSVLTGFRESHNDTGNREAMLMTSLQ